MVGGGGSHKRIASTGSHPPLRPPRPLSERPLIPLGSAGVYSPSFPVIPQMIMTSTSSSMKHDFGPMRSPRVTSPTNPTFGRISEHIHEETETESPIELRRYDELTTRRSRPRIPMSVTDFRLSDWEEVDSIRTTSNSNRDNDSEKWNGSSRSGNGMPVMTATTQTPGISILASNGSPEKRCFICMAPIAAHFEVCDGQCQGLPRFQTLSGEGEYVEYSDSEYDQSPVDQRILSPNVKFSPSPITPTRPLRFSRVVTEGGGGEVSLTPTRSSRQRVDFPPASTITSPDLNSMFTTNTIGWSRVSSPGRRQPNTTYRPEAYTTRSHPFSTSTPPTPYLPATGTLSSPYYSPSLRKGSASSAATTSTSTSTSSSVLSNPGDPSTALFHLERSIKNDPNWSPLVSEFGASVASLPVGHNEILRLGRVPSGEGHQVVIVRADSAGCSSRESSDGSSPDNNEMESCKSEKANERGDEENEGSVVRSVVVRPLSRNERDDDNDNVPKNTTTTTNNIFNISVPSPEDVVVPKSNNNEFNQHNNNEKREAGGSYGDWFSYYAEEARQNYAAAAAAARYVFPFSPLEDGQYPMTDIVSPITNCDLFPNHNGDNRRRILMLEAAARKEEEERRMRKTTTTMTAGKIPGVMTIRRRRSSIYDRIQSIYDAYADLSGEDGESEEDHGEEGQNIRCGGV